MSRERIEFIQHELEEAKSITGWITPSETQRILNLITELDSLYRHENMTLVPREGIL